MAMIGEKWRSFGIKPLCTALGIARASYYRCRSATAPQRSERDQPRALSAEERHGVLSALNEERFCNRAAAQVYATLLDQGQSIRLPRDTDYPPNHEFLEWHSETVFQA